MALNIDWGTALIGAAVGWVASTKVDEVQTKFACTVAQGSAEGVKAAWKAQAKKTKKALKKAGADAGNGNGKNG